MYFWFFLDISYEGQQENPEIVSRLLVPAASFTISLWTSSFCGCLLSTLACININFCLRPWVEMTLSISHLPIYICSILLCRASSAHHCDCQSSEQWNNLKWKGKCFFSRVWLFPTPWTVSVHGILQARILEWVAIPFSRSSWPRNWTCVSCIAGRFFTIWATKEAQGVF